MGYSFCDYTFRYFKWSIIQMSPMLPFFFFFWREEGCGVQGWCFGRVFFSFPWVPVFAWTLMYTIQKWLILIPEWWSRQVFSLAGGTGMSLAVNPRNYRSDLILSSRVRVACCAQNQPLWILQNRRFKHWPKGVLGVYL